MKNLGIIQPIIVLMALVAIILLPIGGITQAETPLLKDYQVVEVQPFEVPLNVPAPDTAGRDLAYEIIYQIMRYSDKFNLFEMVIMEGAQKVPAGKKVLLVKGKITAYSNKGTCAATFQFVDKASGQVLPVQETEAKGFTFRVANYIAQVIYKYTVGGK
ncbi:MAG: hypothetical protein JXA50_05590 [Deltaproteobacteria bacterium]|nr:hypothetical protein [Deltaproteobacteria bacterium]